jgi:hypothetical protein
VVPLTGLPVGSRISLGSDPSVLPWRMLLNVGEIRSQRIALVRRAESTAQGSRRFLEPVLMTEAAENTD